MNRFVLDSEFRRCGQQPSLELVFLRVEVILIHI